MVLQSNTHLPVQDERIDFSNEDDHIHNIYNAEEVWIFGYGSLVWKTNFKYSDRMVGFIEGHARRFWQGNKTFRGTPSKPGRVACLIKKKDSQVWGVAYKLAGRKQIRKGLENLGLRECTNGGYEMQVLPFTPRSSLSTPNKHIYNTIVFNALETNPDFLGPAPVKSMAEYILSCHGSAGSNIEYVIKTAEYYKRNIPEDEDPHMLELTKWLLKLSRTSTFCVSNVFLYEL